MQPDALILGVDLATAKGKPIALSLVRFGSDGTRSVVYWSAWRITEKYIANRILEWTRAYQQLFREARRRGGLDMVAIEDARPRGRGGADMQHLCRVLKDQATIAGIRVELIHVNTVKKEATGRGNAETAEIAVLVRAEYEMPDVPIITGEYDLEMATAIAGAGYAILQKEALGAQE